MHMVPPQDSDRLGRLTVLHYVMCGVAGAESRKCVCACVCVSSHRLLAELLRGLHAAQDSQRACIPVPTHTRVAQTHT